MSAYICRSCAKEWPENYCPECSQTITPDQESPGLTSPLNQEAAELGRQASPKTDKPALGGLFQQADYVPFLLGVVLFGGFIVLPNTYGRFLDLDVLESLPWSIVSCCSVLVAYRRNGTFSWIRGTFGIVGAMTIAFLYSEKSGKPAFAAGGIVGFLIIDICGYAGILLGKLLSRPIPRLFKVSLVALYALTIIVGGSLVLLRAKRNAELRACSDNLKIISLAALMWEEVHPNSVFSSLESFRGMAEAKYIWTPKYFACPGDKNNQLRSIDNWQVKDWKSFDWRSASYSLVGSRVKQGDTQTAFLECPFHGIKCSAGGATWIADKTKAKGTFKESRQLLLEAYWPTASFALVMTVLLTLVFAANGATLVKTEAS